MKIQFVFALAPGIRTRSSIIYWDIQVFPAKDDEIIINSTIVKSHIPDLHQYLNNEDKKIGQYNEESENNPYEIHIQKYQRYFHVGDGDYIEYHIEKDDWICG